MKYTIVYLMLLLCGCHALQVEEKSTQYGRHMFYYDDTGIIFKRIVFSKLPCDSLKLQDQKGRMSPARITRSDTGCYICGEIDAENDKHIGMMDEVKYKNKRFTFITFLPEANLNLSDENCTKFVENFLDKWGDSLSVAIWHSVDHEKGLLLFYIAQETYTYPYYNADRIDSIIFDLNHLCTDKDKEEDKAGMQSLYDRHKQVQINPNPFVESFELTLGFGTITHWFKTTEFKLQFFDENAIELKSQLISMGKTYTFTFPELLPGKTVYYRISWDDYMISGQVLKATQ